MIFFDFVLNTIRIMQWFGGRAEDQRAVGRLARNALSFLYFDGKFGFIVS